MSVWLTPDLDPLYGGTYYPKKDMIQVCVRMCVRVCVCRAPLCTQQCSPAESR